MIKTLAICVVVVIALAAYQLRPAPSEALFHMSVIEEVMTSYGGDSQVQFVEIRMLASSQNFVEDSVLASFDGGGNYVGDVLIVPSNVPNSGVDVRWIMATSALQTVSGLAPDFIMPAGLPTGGGMVCWGAPGVLPPPPGSWDHTDPENYVDCLAYGTYSGPTNSHTGTPTSLNADGHSLRRISETDNNATDFVCADIANPANNAGLSINLASTTPCAPPPTCNGMPATIVGTDAAETIVGTSGADVIVALAGNDTVFGGGGNDRICGGIGDDSINGGAGQDRLLGETGMDALTGGGGFDLCAGGSETDTATTCEMTFGIP